MSTKYIVVEFPSAKELELGVNNLVNKGFKPVGGLSVSCDGIEKRYSQAMWSGEGLETNIMWGIANG